MAMVPYKGKSASLMPVDWESRCTKLALKSDDLKQAGLLERYQTEHDTWDLHARLQSAAHRSNVGLSLRIQDVEKVKEVLTDYLDAIRVERSHLTDALNAIVNALDDIDPLADILNECVVLRREKSAAESLDDDVRRELHGAESALRDVQDRLQRLRSDVEQHVNQLTLEVEGRLVSAVNHQQLALEIDRSQLALTEQSPDLSLQRDPLQRHSAQGSMSEIWWEEQMVALLADAKDVLGRSKLMRESANLEMIRARNELRARKDAVQYSLRKCVHRLEQAVQNLLSQQDILTSELATLDANIRQAMNYRRDMINPLKLTQTRLENRRERPEPCYDFAQRSLESQVEMLGAAYDTMDQRLEHSRATRAQLDEHLDDTRKELSRKKAALDIDRKCLSIIDRFKETFSELRSVKPHYPENFPVPVLRTSYNK